MYIHVLVNAYPRCTCACPVLKSIPPSEEWGPMAIKVFFSICFGVLEFHRSKQPTHLQGLAINNIGQVKEDLGCET